MNKECFFILSDQKVLCLFFRARIIPKLDLDLNLFSELFSWASPASILFECTLPFDNIS